MTNFTIEELQTLVNLMDLATEAGGRYDNTQFLNRSLYGLIIRGAASSSDQISITESWMNTKTLAY